MIRRLREAEDAAKKAHRLARKGRGVDADRLAVSRRQWAICTSRKVSTPCTIKPTDKPFCVFGDNGEAPIPLVSMGGEVAIYVLIDPRDDTVRYVGRSFDPTTRLAYHIAESAGRKGRWIKDLESVGMVPRMEIIDRAALNEWESAEQTWVQFYAMRGSVYNVEVGGRGYLYKEKRKRNRGFKKRRKHRW